MDFIDCLATHGDAPALLFPGTAADLLCRARPARRRCRVASSGPARNWSWSRRSRPSRRDRLSCCASRRPCSGAAAAGRSRGDGGIRAHVLRLTWYAAASTAAGATSTGTGARGQPPSGPRRAARDVGQHGQKPFRAAFGKGGRGQRAVDREVPRATSRRPRGTDPAVPLFLWAFGAELASRRRRAASICRQGRRDAGFAEEIGRPAARNRRRSLLLRVDGKDRLPPSRAAGLAFHDGRRRANRSDLAEIFRRHFGRRQARSS